MKQIHIFPLIALFAACSQPKDHFVLRGTVPGAMDSTFVELIGGSGDHRISLSGYVVNEKFELAGTAPVATYCWLGMNNRAAAKAKGLEGKDALKYVEANFFVENGNLEFATSHIDSLRCSFWIYDICKENNYTLKGSASHDIFDRYRRKTMDLQYRILRETRAEVDEKRKPDTKALVAMKEELHRSTYEFMATNRNLPVNLHLAQSLNMAPFTYSQAELATLTSLFASYRDTLPALLELRKAYREASAYTQGSPFAGVEVYTPKGDTLDVRRYMNPGQYMLIDFWASWCAPCRASFPHLRKVYETFGKKVVFLSVSLDKNDADWRKAMKEEQLPWIQLCATPKSRGEMDKLYKLTSIPTFFIIDSEGKIIFSGHDSGELDVQLGRIF